MSSNDLRSSLRSIRRSLCGMIADTLMLWAMSWYLRADERNMALRVYSIIKKDAGRGFATQRGGMG